MFRHAVAYTAVMYSKLQAKRCTLDDDDGDFTISSRGAGWLAGRNVDTCGRSIIDRLAVRSARRSNNLKSPDTYWMSYLRLSDTWDHRRPVRRSRSALRGLFSYRIILLVSYSTNV